MSEPKHVLIYSPQECKHPREERHETAPGQDVFCCGGCGLTFTGTMWAAIDEHGAMYLSAGFAF